MKVEIRPLRVDDAAISYRWRNDPAVWRYTANRPDTLISEDIERKWLVKAIEDKTCRRFAILVDGVYVGNTQLTNIDMAARSGRLGIFIGNKDYWGKGVAGEATSLILTFAERKLKLRKLFLWVHPDNIAALRTYRKIGFVELSDKIDMMIEFNGQTQLDNATGGLIPKNT